MKLDNNLYGTLLLSVCIFLVLFGANYDHEYWNETRANVGIILRCIGWSIIPWVIYLLVK
jgi:hypothetical protein